MTLNDPVLLFVYGTLLNNDNEFGIYLYNNALFHSKGKFKGKLYDIGEYPGAVISTGEEHYVYGNIYSINDPESVLKVIDNYEGFGEDQPKPNEFIRKMIRVEITNEYVDCWVYLYNLPVQKFKVIESGNYLAFKLINKIPRC